MGSTGKKQSLIDILDEQARILAKWNTVDRGNSIEVIEQVRRNTETIKNIVNLLDIRY